MDIKLRTLTGIMGSSTKLMVKDIMVGEKYGMVKDIMVGEKYGMVTVLDNKKRSAHQDVILDCKCDCGKLFTRKKTVLKYTINRGFIPSCGCNRKFTRKNVMQKESVRKHMSESALKNVDKTRERFINLHDIADGTSYRRLENPSPRKDNKLGIKNISVHKDGKYWVQIKMAGQRFRKSFDNLDDALQYKEDVYRDYINPAIENHKNNC